MRGGFSTEFVMTMNWLAAPVTVTLLATTAVLAGSAVLLIYLSFGPWTGRFVQTFRGVVAPFFGAVTLMLGILIGFLSNDVWDRNRRAGVAVKSEADDLVALVGLMTTFQLPAAPVATSVRAYARVVVDKEWPRMADGESAPEAEHALDELLRVIVQPVRIPSSNLALDRVLLDTALAVRNNRNARLALSRDESAPLKWAAVLILALLSQASIAAVHLDKLRPQILAISLYTAGLIFIIGLLVVHEVPFEPPAAVSPAPIAHVLDLVPDPGAESAAPGK